MLRASMTTESVPVRLGQRENCRSTGHAAQMQGPERAGRRGGELDWAAEGHRGGWGMDESCQAGKVH